MVLVLMCGKAQASPPDTKCCAQMSVYHWQQETCHLHLEQGHELLDLVRAHC